MVTALPAKTPASRPGIALPRGTLLIGLTLVLLAAAWLRFTGLGWDENQHLHPDERFLSMVAAAERWPGSLGEYLDEARSPLNPRNVGFDYFAYGTLPTTMVVGLAAALGWTGLDAVTAIGRFTSATFDLGTVLLVFFIARRLYDDDRIALAAAALLAASVLPIQHAHFFVVDTFATFFVTASIWALTGAQHRPFRWYAIAGALFGLALACKLSIATFAIVIAAAAFGIDRTTRFKTGTALLAVAGGAALLTFRLGQPDAFQGFVWISPRWFANLLATAQIASGAVDFPPGVQWASRTPLAFPLTHLVLWGVGPALGVASLAATIVAGWQLIARGRTRHMIPVLWTTLVVLHQGSGFVMAGRYFLPTYPMLALLAAWLLTTAVDRARQASPRHAILARALVAIVGITTALWAVAFTQIYRQPNSRVEASRWIYANIPARAVIAHEHWDDRVPLPLEGLSPDRYAFVELTNYDDDTPEKLEALLLKLQAADHIVVSSNRLYDSIPRMPMRYPMTTRYYRMLFSGELGFEQVADFTSYPSLSGFVRPDQSAEESFTVYDHARVQVFSKTSRWNLEATRLALGSVDWQGVVNLLPRDAHRFKNGIMLSAAARAEARRSGASVHPSGPANRFPVVVWSAVLFVLGLLAFPLTAIVFRGLPDRGWLLSKSVGLLLVGYGGWMVGSLRWLPFTRWTVVAVCGVVGAAGFVAAWRDRQELAEFFRRQRTLLLREEALFWVCYAGFLIVRAGNPDLWHPNVGGEKPMDFAYLNAVVRSDYFPPANPWFAGAYINYYYFGFVLTAALAKVSGIVPSIAYNLAVPTFLALTAAGAFTVAYALASSLDPRPTMRRLMGPFACGVAAVLFVTILGNLVEAGLLLRSFVDEQARGWPGWTWYWSATRVIPHLATEAPPISEFPFFTMLYGDLHAHLMALPYTLLALACALELVWPASRSGPRTSSVPIFVLLALVVGSLYPLNTWDYPTYLLIAGLAILAREWIGRRAGESALPLAIAAGRFAAVVAAGRLMFHPFFSSYSQAYGSVVPWMGSHSTLASYLSIHGLFVFVLVSWCVWRLRDGGFVERARSDRSGPFLLLVTLVAAGLLLGLAVEVVVLANDVDRMNTVFKFYFQVWILWGCAAAVCLRDLVNERPRGRMASAWLVALLVLVASAAFYPAIATPARWRDRLDPAAGFGLDGRAYMRTATHREEGRSFSLAPDLEAITWMESNLEGSPVIAEAHTSEYRWGGRISWNTGLPTVLGWSAHQGQQRAALPRSAIQRREADVAAIFSDGDADRVAVLLERYAVEYVYVGPLERALYPASGLEKFAHRPDRWRPVYQTADVVIYRVER